MGRLSISSVYARHHLDSSDPSVSNIDEAQMFQLLRLDTGNEPPGMETTLLYSIHQPLFG